VLVREYSSMPFLSWRAIVDFAEPTGPLEQDDAALGAVALRGALSRLHGRIKGTSRPNTRRVRVRVVAEELVADELLLVSMYSSDTVREHHVVEALVRVSR